MADLSTNEPLKIPTAVKSPIVPNAYDEPVVAKAMSYDETMTARGEKPAFIPPNPAEDDFIEPAYTRIGTKENFQAYSNIVDKSNPAGVVIKNKIDYALKDKEQYDKDLASYVQGMKDGKLLLSRENPPKDLHPLSKFLTSFGKNDQEAISGLSRAILRADFYKDRYIRMGVSKLIDSDDSLLSAPEALFEHMKNAKMFRTKAEEDFFKEGYQNKYSGQYETSPFSLIQQEFAKKYKGTMHPSQLKTNVDEYGFRLNPKNPNHVKLFRDYNDWNDKHPDMTPLMDRFSHNFNETLGMLVDAVSSAVYGSVSSIGDPEISWNKDFKDEEAKQEFNKNMLILASARSDGSKLEGFTHDSALYMVEKNFAKTGKVDMDMLDEPTKTKIPQIIVEIAKQYKELDSRGAFDKDVRGLTSMLTSMSAMVTGGIGLSMMAINSDPNSISMNVVNSFKTVLDYPDEAISLAKHWEENKMIGMNTGADYAKWHHHLASEGIFGSSVVDSRWHKDASMFMTPFEGVAIAGGLVNLGKATATAYARGAGINQATGLEKNFLQRVGLQESLDSTMHAIKTLSRQGVDFVSGIADIEVKQMLENIKAEGVKAGEVIDDYEAVRRAFAGKGKVIDPKSPTGKLIPAPESVINQLSDSINAAAKSHQTVRDAIVGAAREGRQVKYSESTMNGIAKARKALQTAYPEIKWEDVPDMTIYDRLRSEGFPLTNGVETLSQNEIRAMSKEVGSVWRRVDLKDIAGFQKRGGLLQVDIAGVDNPVTSLISGTLSGFGKFGEWADKLEKAYGSPRSSISAVARVSSSPGISVSTLQGNSPGFFRWSLAVALPAILRTAGAGSEIMEFMRDYTRKNELVAGNEFNSTLLGMRRDYNEEIKKLLIEKASITRGNWKLIREKLNSLGETVVTEEPLPTGSSVNVEKEVARIDKRIEYLDTKAGWAKNLSAWGKDGILAQSTRAFGDGMVAFVPNEILMGITDNFAGMGGGSAFAVHGGGLNAITSGWMAHMTKGQTLRERTNMDQYELRGRLDNMGQDAAGDVQRMKLLKIWVKAKDNADLITKQQGSLAGETYYAREIFTLANLYRTNFDIIWTDAGVRNGLVSLMEGIQFQDPEYADALKKKYLDVANKMGMKGRAATDYAKQMLSNVIEHNAAKVRLGNVSKEISTLEAKKIRINETTGAEVEALSQGAEILAKESGMDYQQLITIGGNKGDMVGLENTNIGGIDIGKVSPDIANKLKVFQKEAARIEALKTEKNQQIIEINDQLTALKDEHQELSSTEAISPYRDGQITLSPLDNSSFISFKNGITIWENDGKGAILLDEDKFSTAVAREEISHALMFSENMKDSRAQLRNMIFGEIKIDPKTGARNVSKQPTIAKDVESSLKLMDMFMDAHSKTLSENEAIWFNANWEKGKKNFARNPDDTRLLMGGLLEFAGKLYQSRLELANPHMGRGEGVGSTVEGSIEMSGIPIRMQDLYGPNRETTLSKLKGGARLMNKLVFGDLKIQDIVNDGNPINAIDIDFTDNASDPKHGYTERVKDAIKFTLTFGRGGLMDKFWNNATVLKLTEYGFQQAGNESPDYMKFWKYGTVRHPTSGEVLPIHPSAQNWAEQMIAHSRNRGTSPDIEALSDFESVFNESEDTSDIAKRRRWMWALASGRGKFINPETGMFNKSLNEMMKDEWKPIGSLIQRIIKPEIGDDGDWSGMTVKKTVDGRNVLIGAPNATQTRRIIDHIKANYGKGSEGNEVTMKNIAIFLEAIADGNIFDPKARTVENGGAPGWTQTFLVEYSGVWQRKGVGTTAKTRVGGTNPTLRMLTPIGIVIRDSSLDTVGKKKTADENGEVPGMPEMYVICHNAVAATMAKENAWNGQLFMEGGERFFGKSQNQAITAIRRQFGNKENLQTAMDLVLENYQHAGSIARKSTTRPPEESWEILLDMNDGNPGEAKKMASMVNRILGFQQTDFMELNGLEQLALKKKLTISQENRREDLRDKFEEEDDKGETKLEKIGIRERQMAAFYGERPNLYGRSPMKDAQSPISMFRIDRFTGEATPVIDSAGNPRKMRWNQFTQGWGNANYAAQNWQPMTMPTLATNISLRNMGGKTLTEGYTHLSGYTLYKMQDAQIPTTETAPKSQWILFNPEREVVGQGYESKEKALDSAEQDSVSRTMPPQKSNAIELALKKEGWSPRGINFSGKIRDTFVSDDGKWIAEKKYSGNTSGYDLIDIETGVIVASGIKLGMKIDKKTPNVGDLNAAVQAALEGGSVQIKLTKEYIATLKETQGLLDYTIVNNKKTRKAFAAQNPIYYDIRQEFAKSFGWKKVNEITSIMRKELGDEVVSTDSKAVREWVEKWTSSWSAEELTNIGKRASEDAKLKNEEVERDIRLTTALRFGELSRWEKPTEPKVPNPKHGQKGIDKFNEQMIKFNEESIAWEKHRVDLDERNLNEDGINWIVKYVKSLKGRQAEFDQMSKLQGDISLEAFNTARARGPIDQLTLLRNTVAEAGQVAESQWWNSKSGYVIQQLMYKAPKPAFGIQVTHPKLFAQTSNSVDILGKRVLGSGGDVVNAKYVIYNPSGQIIAREDELSKAADRVHEHSQGNWLKNYLQQQIDNNTNTEPKDVLKGPTQKGAMPSRADINAGYRYNKPAPR